MDRCNEVKILLKKWEQSFSQTNNRKPNKDDIDKAPEETRQLYKEYRSLKEAKERKSSEQEDQAKPSESHSSTAGSGCWGSHLDRKSLPAAVPKLSSDDKETLKASAQYFGMKLKNNLGALTKERPFSLKKSATPRRTPAKPLQETPSSSAAPADEETHTPKSANTRPDPSAPPVQTTSTAFEDEPPDPFPSVTPSKSWCSPAVGSAQKSVERVQFLRKSITKRISAVDSGWLSRCQVFDEVEELQKPVAGNLELTENESSFLPPAVRSKTVSNQGQTSQKTSLEKSKSNLSENGALKDQEATLLRDSVVLDANLGSPGPHGEQVYQKETAAPAGDGEMCSEDPRSPAKTKKRKSRARKDQDSGEKPQAEGGKKTKGRKRRREGDDDGVDESEEQEGGVKKRRRTKKGVVDGEDLPQKGRKKKGKVIEEDDAEEEEKTQKRGIPQENLLGEVDEVEARAAAYAMKNSARGRPTKNTEGNFVKINLKKKSHVKGFALRGAVLRKQMYVQKFQLKGERFGGGFGRGRGRFGGFSRQGDSCYKCGGTGHWARDCRGKAPDVSSAEQQETPVEEEEFELPTLEEVARATGTLRSEPIVAPPSMGGASSEREEQEAEPLLNIIRPDYERPAPPPPMEPLYTPKDDGTVQDVPPEVYEALRDFGYKSFRSGQETAIMRILSGGRTLLEA